MQMDNEEVFIELELTLNKSDAQDLTAIIDQGDVLADLSGYYEVLYEEGNLNNDSTRLVFYFPIRAEFPNVQLELLLAATGISRYEIKQKPVKKDEYLESYKKYYKPFRISSHFVIIPSWERDSEETRKLMSQNDIPLILDPGIAFGTGQHPTTRMCIQYLDEIIQPGDRVIDAGCGSGILSIAAVLKGAAHAFAFDIDGNAITAVKQNMLLNNIDPARIETKTGGFDLEEFASYRADLFIGNLTKNIILQWSNTIEDGNFSRIVISGVLSEKKEDLIAYFSSRWNLTKSVDDEGWALLEFRRKDSSFD